MTAVPPDSDFRIMDNRTVRGYNRDDVNIMRIPQPGPRHGLAAAVLILAIGLTSIAAGDPPAPREWQKLTTPGVREVAGRFADPPAEYGLTMWWFWNGR